MRNGDVISGAVLAALGAYIVFESSGWTYVGDDGPGPAFFPLWYGIAMVVLALVLATTAIVKGAKPEQFDWPGIGRAFGTWLVFAICAGLMGWLGFVVSFAVFSLFIGVVVFHQPVAKASIIALGVTAGFYLVFPFALSVPLPTGIFGF